MGSATRSPYTRRYTDRAFAALREDGAVVTWGDAAFGGDSSLVAGADLRNDVNTLLGFMRV